MQEFECIKVSAYEAETLAGRLTERSAAGWSVVSVVAAGSDIVAYLSRVSTGAASMTSAQATAPANAEPSGWGTAPAATEEREPAASAAGYTGWGDSGGGSWGSSGAAGGGQGWGSSTASEPAATSTPAAAATPAVPAGWYNDPANRYELRYWDGSAWTEHVSRGGQQYTDPPVA